MKTMQKGFTLIELMIVVAIIGILAAVALPAYQDYTARSQVSETLSLMAGPQTAVTEFWSNKGKLPNNNASAGLSKAASISGKYVSNVEVKDGIIIAAIKSSGVAKGIVEGQIALSPITTAGSVKWTCTTNHVTDANKKLKDKFIPSSCR